MTAPGRLGGLAARLGLTEGQVWTSALGLALGVALLATSVPPVWERRGQAAGAALAAPPFDGPAPAAGAEGGAGGGASDGAGGAAGALDLGGDPASGPAPVDAAPVAPPGAAFPDLPPGPGPGDSGSDLGAAADPDGTSGGGTAGGGAAPGGTGGGPSGSGPGGGSGTGPGGSDREATGVLRVREGAWSSSAPEPGVPDGGLPLGVVLGDVSAVSYVRLTGSGAVLRLPLSDVDGASYGTPPTRARACRITDARWTPGPDRDPVPFDPADCASASLGPSGLTVDLTPFEDRTGRAGFALLVDPASAPPPVRSSRVVLAPAPPS